jgi:hypothetical protein
MHEMVVDPSKIRKDRDGNPRFSVLVYRFSYYQEGLLNGKVWVNSLFPLSEHYCGVPLRAGQGRRGPSYAAGNREARDCGRRPGGVSLLPEAAGRSELCGLR